MVIHSAAGGYLYSFIMVCAVYYCLYFYALLLRMLLLHWCFLHGLVIPNPHHNVHFFHTYFFNSSNFLHLWLALLYLPIFCVICVASHLQLAIRN